MNAILKKKNNYKISNSYKSRHYFVIPGRIQRHLNCPNLNVGSHSAFDE